jgi:hypothetical protein
MKTHLSEPTSFEFCFPQLDTLALVENQRDEVVIRLTRDTFSAERKTHFIRELAAEGFIAEDYRWISTRTPFSTLRVSWLLDRAWLKPDPALIAKTRRCMVGLLAGGVLLWLILLTAVLCGAVGPDLSNAQPRSTVRSTHG